MLYLLGVILILTGSVQSGKTRFLSGVVSDLDRARTVVSGYISPAVYESGRLIGYDLSILGREKPLPFLRKHGPPRRERIGPYSFLPEALREARRTIRESRPGDLLVVDEVGPLELAGGGVWAPLQEVLASPARRCLLVVRAACLETLRERLGGHTSKVFPVEEPTARASLLFEIGRSGKESGPLAGREG